MKISQITQNANYNFKTNNAKFSTINSAQDNIKSVKYQQITSPMFCGILANLDKLKEQHKIVNKAYKIQAEATKAINQANFLRDDALYYVKKDDTTRSELTRKHLILTRFITRTDDNGNILLDCTYNIDENEKVRNLVKFDKNKNIESIAVNANYDEDFEVTKADKIFYFVDNKLVSFVDNYFMNTIDNTVAMGGQYSLLNGDLITYSKGVVTDIATGDVTSQETYEFKDSKISEYTKDMRFSPDEQTITYAKLINFDRNERISNIFENKLRHINID